MNLRKRGPTETDTDADTSRSTKKLKKETTNAAAKKDKKKRRKRKRKLSVVAVEPEPCSISKSRSVTAATQSPVPEPSADADVDPPPATAPPDDAEDMVARIPYADKGKAKATDEAPTPPLETIESPEAQIARLQQELERQTLLLRRHQTHLNQVYQALTCQICLDLLHKPFALAPCGHVVCHGCLVQWFTAPDPTHPLQEALPGAPGAHSHVRKKKKCPICRTQITERPVEVYGVKSMVAGIVRSGLVELPAPPPDPSSSDGPEGSAPDPWQNIFRRANARPFFDLFAPRPPRDAGPEGDGGLEAMGMYDAEDGGIYRCIDCMHELWAGICTQCQRVYPGHRRDGDSDEDGDEDDFEQGQDDMYFAAERRREPYTIGDLFDMMARRRHPFAMGADESQSESDDLDGLWDDQDSFSEDDEDVIFPPWLRPGLDLLAPRMLLEDGHHDSDDQEELGIARIEEEGQEGSGSEEEGYESSFIDDAEGVPAVQDRRGRRGSRHETIVLSDDDSDSDDDIVAVVRPSARRARMAPRRGNRAIVVHSDDDTSSSLSGMEIHETQRRRVA
ncbi:hypothetical protein H0H81_006538 [Sphagnurus paluster]|uniref:RING-type domain-containing protein n=1 Tax=Sphagnurus paluster TaxID=117069 RepID=A0A9P7FXG5_9AGAR|nr:hypothetical protein H0H81_006538 [Sphagnurus paluster]